jgi:hypothetical protein
MSCLGLVVIKDFGLILQAPVAVDAFDDALLVEGISKEVYKLSF